jgi:hypothetical protein
MQRAPRERLPTPPKVDCPDEEDGEWDGTSEDGDTEDGEIVETSSESEFDTANEEEESDDFSVQSDDDD